MIGIVVGCNIQEVDQIRLDWYITVDRYPSGIGVPSIKYVLITLNGKARFLGKVQSVTVYPNESSDTLRLELSAFVYSDGEIPGMTDGANGDIAYINKSEEKKLSKIFEGEHAKLRPSVIPLHLSIDDAVKALHQRYGIDEAKIKISLHN
ncbi:hypothetical protein [Pseudomonas sp. DSP3-2-2]|uniref:hypothetical protein n=1 Tax=unclassified Pseudomonas TaxID=196821 RepID=UPI003CF0762D